MDEQAFCKSLLWFPEDLFRKLIFFLVAANFAISLVSFCAGTPDWGPIGSTLCCAPFAWIANKQSWARRVLLFIFTTYIGSRLLISIVLPEHAPLTVIEGYPLPYALLGPPAVFLMGASLGLRGMRDTLPLAISIALVGNVHMALLLTDQVLMQYIAATNLCWFMLFFSIYSTELSRRRRWSWYPYDDDDLPSALQPKMNEEVCQISFFLNFANPEDDSAFLRSEQAASHQMLQSVARLWGVVCMVYVPATAAYFGSVDVIACIVPFCFALLYMHSEAVASSLSFRRLWFGFFSVCANSRLLMANQPRLSPAMSEIQSASAMGGLLTLVAIALVLLFTPDCVPCLSRFEELPAKQHISKMMHFSVFGINLLMIWGITIMDSASLTAESTVSEQAAVWSTRRGLLNVGSVAHDVVLKGHPVAISINGVFTLHSLSILLGVRHTLDAWLTTVVTAILSWIHVNISISSVGARANYGSMVLLSTILQMATEYWYQLDQRKRWLRARILSSLA